MPTLRLRIMHNGQVFQKNPHWHLWIYNHGGLLGEMIGRQSDFKAVQRFEGTLADSTIATLFGEAESMLPRFKQREEMCLPDDVMVELNEYRDGKQTTVFWYVIPLNGQRSPRASAFLGMVNSILDPHV